MTSHILTMQKAWPNGFLRYRATCTCGWQGTALKFRYIAKNEFMDHREANKEETKNDTHSDS